ncbi:unnamed protein product [Phaedon cochleariae]|uniref:Uncharacterized protein n=1 Tax=Phaedon cochleariae TaxID=80249 RepID=A0A9N9SJ51_PHACE|nr:unnamed protein product [Phaedon cochleariae]
MILYSINKPTIASKTISPRRTSPDPCSPTLKATLNCKLSVWRKLRARIAPHHPAASTSTDTPTFHLFHNALRVNLASRYHKYGSRESNRTLNHNDLPESLVPKAEITMTKVVVLLSVLIVVVVSAGPAWKEVQRGGGLKVGSERGKNSSASRGNGLKIGGSTRGFRSTTASAPEEDHIQAPTLPSIPPGIMDLHVGLVVPYKSFGTREYTKSVTSAKAYVSRKLKLFKHYDIKVHYVMKQMTPSPTGRKGV